MCKGLTYVSRDFLAGNFLRFWWYLGLALCNDVTCKKIHLYQYLDTIKINAHMYKWSFTYTSMISRTHKYLLESKYVLNFMLRCKSYSGYFDALLLDFHPMILLPNLDDIHVCEINQQNTKIPAVTHVNWWKIGHKIKKVNS